jgi:hypothetical protein
VSAASAAPATSGTPSTLARIVALMLIVVLQLGADYVGVKPP